MTAKPQMSGTIIRDTFEALSKIGARERVLAQLPPGSEHRLTTLLDVEWADLEDHVALYDTTLKVLGPTRACELWRDTMVSTSTRGLLRKLVLGLGRALGPASVEPLLKSSPRAWASGTRGCGEQTVQFLAKGHMLLRFERLPQPLVRSEAFCMAMRAKGEGLLAVLRLNGTIKEILRDETSGRLHFEFRWTESAAGAGPR